MFYDKIKKKQKNSNKNDILIPASTVAFGTLIQFLKKSTSSRGG